MTNVITFQEAIKKADTYNTKHLLLGNGFSIACVPSIFTYNSLFEEADFSIYPEIEKAFSLTRARVNQIIKPLIDAGLVIREGQTRATTYRLP